jgi:cytochrome P450/NADPH-cytochrome P450 reductase
MDIYREKKSADEAAASRWIDDMGTQNRYVLDVWAGS